MIELNSVEKYIQKTLGVMVEVFPTNTPLAVPVFINQLYKFYRVTIHDKRYLMMVIDSAEVTPPLIKKHLDIVENEANLNAFIVLEKIDSNFRDKLVNQHIPFVVPGNQMYLPFIGVDFRERFGSLVGYERKSEKLSVAAQLTALYFLHSDSDVYRQADIALKINYTKMSASRAVDELYEHGLIKILKEGKENLITLNDNRYVFWESLKKVMRSPVKHRYSIESFRIDYKKFTTAGLSALERLTDITAPINPTIAMTIKEWGRLYDAGVAIVKHGDVDVEVWAYDPDLFSREGLVNKYSLYLSLMSNPDERIEMALDQLLEGDNFGTWPR
ncbi:MAG: hypothetical protein HOP06_08075 [Methylotenera sp.]|nr:hypothetical protein [Methylotenera sp.]